MSLTCCQRQLRRMIRVSMSGWSDRRDRPRREAAWLNRGMLAGLGATPPIRARKEGGELRVMGTGALDMVVIPKARLQIRKRARNDQSRPCSLRHECNQCVPLTSLVNASMRAGEAPPFGGSLLVRNSKARLSSWPSRIQLSEKPYRSLASRHSHSTDGLQHVAPQARWRCRVGTARPANASQERRRH